MRRPGSGFAMLLALCAVPAVAQPSATSPRPDRVAVTVYRAPHRPPQQALNLRWLNGYALISETRTVSIPAGDSVIRFEGVAGGIVPQSAIVRGFAEDVIERNHDAWLLSPASLLDRSLGRRVQLRRTSRATGRVVEQDAVIRSGADGAVVVETEDGVEALRCTGLPETIVYPGVPEGLSARPTLSVRARSSRAVTATITLSYLATGFDWQASYVLTLSPEGDRADLFAWLTLANTDETSFVDADTQAVAGRLNRVQNADPRERAAPSPYLSIRCWPHQTTSDIPLAELPGPEGQLPPPAMAPLDSSSPLAVVQDEEFQLSGSRIARQEDLGDLKLYRLPEPVTIASNSQKQVAMIRQPGVQVETVYRRRLQAGDPAGLASAVRVLVTRNREAEGLGLPLPAGRVVLFAGGGERPMLLGEGFVRDLAVGEDVEIELEAGAPGVASITTLEREGKGWRDFAVTAHNDRGEPIRFELELDVPAEQRLRPERRLDRRDGRPVWIATVPANGTATLRYRLIERRNRSR